jgi:hypothetical protein
VNNVEENGEEVKKMELWSSPNAIYYQDIEADVFGQACMIQLYMVNTNTVRMAAYEFTEEEENS